MIKSFDDLNQKIEVCSKALENKFTGEDGKRAIVLCGGTGCLSSNSAEIQAKFERLVKENDMENIVSVNKVGCFGFCSQGPFVKIYPEDTLYRLVTIDDVDEIFEQDIKNHEVVERLLFVDPATHEKVTAQDDINFYKKQVRVALHGCGQINPEEIDEALGFGAFRGLERALKMDRADVVKEVLDSGLRGRGGAGFPAGRKWDSVRRQPKGKKYVVCNGDEGDPGAFMDRSIMEGNPHSVLEGMMIAGLAAGSDEGYIYVRAEYPLAVERLRIAIAKDEELGLLGDNILGTDFSFHLHINRGAGAFVCGEGSALTASIEGKRGMPRVKPPRTVEQGLWVRPTVLNNVETYANVPQIILRGSAWFHSIGTEKSPGTKAFALTGNVVNTGLIEVPMGATLREIIFDIGGGIKDGKKFKAVQTGGPSGGCLTEKHLDTPIDFDNLLAEGSMMGSGGMIVMDEDDCMVSVSRFYLDFTVEESCGKCTPCRIGNKRLLEMLNKITEGRGTMKDLDALSTLGKVIKDTALCGLGQTSPNPVLSTLNNFYDEYVEHVRDKTCRAKQCKALLTYTINPELCIGCHLCFKHCPADAILGDVRKPHVINPDKCIKCGMCMARCKFKAINVV